MLSTSRAGPRAAPPPGPMTRPRAAGRTALPAADAATWTLTTQVAPAAPVRSAVVSVSSGKIGAAARPTTAIPVSGRAAAGSPGGAGTVSRAAPATRPATPAVRTRAGPIRSARGPSPARPANIVAQ